MPNTAGPHKAPKQTRKEKKCEGCLSLKFVQDEDGETKTFESPYGPTNRERSLMDIVKSMSGGCQICFAILKAIDALLMPYINGPPGFLATLFPRPHQASKFRFLAYLQSPWLSHISILERKGRPVQVHVYITMLMFDIAEDKFGIGKATRPNVYAAFGGAATDLEFIFELFSDHLDPAPFHGIAPARRVPARLSSARRRRLVKEWIDGCVEKQRPCREPLLGQEDDDLNQPWRPKRLLDLGDSPRTSIRLVDGAGTTGPYATVSHVWKRRGSSDLVLDMDTLPKLMEERIRWRDLPPLFQDAVVIASEQNIRYLWIHALCVNQEDAQDLNWHTEQAHRIYGRSYLNIALERSTHLHETCLGTRWLQRGKGTEVQDVEIPVFKDGKPYKLYARPAVHHRESHLITHYEPTYFPYHLPRKEKDILHCPLLNSTDFLQEQIIAPRTLHVDTTELAWECRLRTGCECRPLTTKIAPEYFSVVTLLKLKLATVQKACRAEEDRLSPLVGLGSCVAPMLGMKFAGGLVFNDCDDLASQLMWYIENAITLGLDADAPGRKRVARGGAYVPSWSWVSMVTEHAYFVGSPSNMFDVNGGSFARDSDFQVHGIDNMQPRGIITPKQQQPGGEPPCPHDAHNWKLPVSGGLITGKIATRRHRILYPSTGIYKFVAANAECSLPPPSSQEPSSSRNTLVLALPPPPTEFDKPPFGAGFAMLDCGEFDAERRRSAALSGHDVGFTLAHFLLLGRVERTRSMEPGDAPAVDVGLVLRRAGGGETGEFERIGVFWLAAGRRGMFDEGLVQDVVLV